jgi:hypothetical protein
VDSDSIFNNLQKVHQKYQRPLGPDYLRRLRVLWFGYEVFPTAHCWRLGLQLLVLLWEVLKTLGDGAWLEEVSLRMSPPHTWWLSLILLDPQPDSTKPLVPWSCWFIRHCSPWQLLKHRERWWVWCSLH